MNIKVRQRGLLTLLVLLLVCGAAVVTGCGSASEADSTVAVKAEPQNLSGEKAKQVLKELPYRYEFKSVKLPTGASDAFAAKVYGPHHTTFSIGVALGEQAKAVPVPGAGTWNAVGNGEFVFNNDILIPKGGKVLTNEDLHTRIQWHTANEMATAMEEKLCRAETGKPCSV